MFAKKFYVTLYISEASGLEDISLVSTPKRSSTSQTVSTPASVPVIESAEAIEAKAALKQVKTSLLHLYLGLGFMRTWTVIFLQYLVAGNF